MKVVIYLAFAQAMASLFLIVSNYTKKSDDKLLSYFLFFAVLHLILKVFIIEYLKDSFLFYNFITPSNIVYTPILFLYLKSILGNIIKPKEVLFHFIPFAISAVAYFILGLDYLNGNNELKISVYSTIMRVACILSLTLYPLTSLIIIRKNTSAITNKKVFNTLIVLNGTFISMIIYGFFFREMENDKMFYVAYLGYFLIFVLIVNLRLNRQPTNQSISKYAKKYVSSKLSILDIEDIENKLLDFIKKEKSLYLKTDFNLEKLSKAINIPKHHISQVLNERLDQNFQQFINQYRIEHFCNLLSKANLENTSIISLAYECGFNSKSSFNSNFKKVVGVTPTKYIEEIQNGVFQG